MSAVLLKRLGFSHQQIIQDYMESKANLMDFLTSYVRTHPKTDISILIPRVGNIQKVLSFLDQQTTK